MSKQSAVIFVVLAIALAGAGWFALDQHRRLDPIYAWRAEHENATASEQTSARNFFYEKLAARHPELVIVYKEVPDAQNGFLHWLEFEKRHPSSPLFVSDPEAILEDSAGWNSERARQWLEDNAALMAEIRAVALLPDRSVKGIKLSPFGFTNTRLRRQCVDPLCLQARIEAERGDWQDSLESMRAARGLTDHADRIESPSFLDATVGLLLRKKVRETFFEDILPLLSLSGEEMANWEDAILAPAVSPSDMAALVRGEWHVSVHFMILGLMGDKTVKDPSRLLEAWADLAKRQVTTCGTSNLLDLGRDLSAVRADTADLTEESAQLLETVSGESIAEWVSSWARQGIETDLARAAFAHLKGKPVPVEPLTLKPYVWDPVARSFSLPSDARLDSLKVEPIKLPK
jgi:hypothetical protein